MKQRSVYSIEYENLIKEISDTISSIMRKSQFESTDIPRLKFINTTERKSKYIAIHDKHFILVDLHQVIECVWGLEVASAIDDDVLLTISGARGNKKDYDISMSKFMYSSNQNIIKAWIFNCYSLADICFSKGYVDAAVKNLLAAKWMREDIHCDNWYATLSLRPLINIANNIGSFIYLHELTHYFIEHNKNNLSKSEEYIKLIELIRVSYESGILNQEWDKLAKRYSSENYSETIEIEEIFSEFKISERYPKLLELLIENIFSWKKLSFDSNDWDLYSEELICDIIALNAIISNNPNDYDIISFIIKLLLMQETASLQNNLLMYVTGQQVCINSQNIKRAQLILSALIVDYNEYRNQQEWDSIFNYLDYDVTVFDDLLIDVFNSMEMIYENVYLVAIKYFCKSLLSQDILHKHLNCAYFLDDSEENFVFTDDYNGEKYTEKRHLSNFDAILLQQDLTFEYNKFVNYVFE